MSTTLILPSVRTSRSEDCGSANWLGSASAVAHGAVEIQRLADECALQPEIRRVAADLVRLTAREARKSEGIVQPGPLVAFRIQPELRAAPEARAEKEGRIGGFPAHVRRQTVRPRVWSMKAVRLLLGVGRLSVDGEPGFGCGCRRVGRGIRRRWRRVRLRVCSIHTAKGERGRGECRGRDLHAGTGTSDPHAAARMATSSASDCARLFGAGCHRSSSRPETGFRRQTPTQPCDGRANAFGTRRAARRP